MFFEISSDKSLLDALLLASSLNEVAIRIGLCGQNRHNFITSISFKRYFYSSYLISTW